jgi:hypothetical protein
MRNARKILISNPKRKRPLVKSRRTLKDNIKMDLKEQDVRVWSEFIWLRRECSDGVL